jgi:hypothetical protein
MNCKPGDLAIVVRGMYSDENVGKLVRTVRLVPLHDADGPSWEVESLSGFLMHPRVELCGLRGWFEDSRLRPIRDPGDDAQDEMLVLLGKPEQITA